MRRLRQLALLPLLALLGACNTVVLHPSGYVAAQQRDVLVISTFLMLLIILPVMALTVFFAWRYRAGNTNAPYDPDWDHSSKLELIIWTAPLLIIICLGALTWLGSHMLDPYRPLNRISPDQEIAADTQPLEVEVAALDWKWLFIYPQYGIATVNQLAAPVDRPIEFKLTSTSVMNAFYIPALAGMVATMPAMETKLHAVINEPGDYTGLSTNYSGAGFSDMNFRFLGQSTQDFDQWVQKVKSQGKPLSRDRYLQLALPSEASPVLYFSSVDDNLYHDIVNLCVKPGKMCMDEMMHIDAQGGAGKHSGANREKLVYDAHPIDGHLETEAPGATAPFSNRAPHSDSPNGNNQSEPDKGKGTIAPQQLNEAD